MAVSSGALRRLYLHDARQRAELEELFGRDRREQVHQPGDDPGPAGLMAGAESGPVVAVEVLVEAGSDRASADLPGTSGCRRRPAVGRPCLFRKMLRKPARDLLGDLIQVHLPAGAGGAFDGEVVAVVACSTAAVRG